MRPVAPHRTQSSAPSSVRRNVTVCVVDPQANDYRAWHAAEARAVQLQILPDAESALRHSRSTPVDLWVINTELPGLSGCELCGMLKSRSPQTPVFLVSDDASPAAERSAWAAKATMFGQKPSHLAWLNAWLAHHARPRTSP